MRLITTIIADYMQIMCRSLEKSLKCSTDSFDLIGLKNWNVVREGHRTSKQIHSFFSVNCCTENKIISKPKIGKISSINDLSLRETNYTCEKLYSSIR